MTRNEKVRAIAKEMGRRLHKYTKKEPQPDINESCKMAGVSLADWRMYNHAAHKILKEYLIND